MNLSQAFLDLARLWAEYVAAKRAADRAEAAFYDAAGPVLRTIGAELGEQFDLVETMTGGTDDAPEGTVEVIADGVRPGVLDDHTLDDFHGQQVPRSARITMLTATHWRGELLALGVSIEGAPDAVAQQLRDAVAFQK